MAAVMTNIFSGLVANLLLLQFLQYGPNWLAVTLQARGLSILCVLATAWPRRCTP